MARIKLARASAVHGDDEEWPLSSARALWIAQIIAAWFWAANVDSTNPKGPSTSNRMGHLGLLSSKVFGW